MWTNGWRVLAYGELGKTLVANGYDFDPVNDDLLQNVARFEDGHVRIKDYAYRVLILPSIRVIPLATLERIAQFADSLRPHRVLGIGGSHGRPFHFERNVQICWRLGLVKSDRPR